MGLLDWITDGGGELFNSNAPSVAATNNYQSPGSAPLGPDETGQRPSPPPMPPSWRPNIGSGASPDDLNGGIGAVQPGSRPPMPPVQGLDLPLPSPQQLGGEGIGPAAVSGQPGQQPPPVPMPRARPPGADTGAIPPPPPEKPPGPPMNIAPASPGVGAPPMPPQSQSGFSLPTMEGGGGLLGALGVGDQNAKRFRGALGAGLTAAGNSAGKSPMQALSGGAGAAIEGGDKSADKNTDQTLKYLDTAIKAQRAGDTAAYNVAYAKYLAAKLKQDTDKMAGGRNDPNSLYLAAGRLTNSDPALKGYNDAIRAARAGGNAADIAKAQGELEKAKTDIMNGHLGRLGLSPQQAAQVAQQPGMTVGNAIDAGKMGITEKNIAQKLRPGQYYRNPKDGQIYQFNGGPANGSTPDKPTAPEPRDPNRPERGTRADAGADDDLNQDGA